MSQDSTLFPPSPINPGKSEIESVLELTSLSLVQNDLFTNTRPLWQPPGSRGIYGGAVIAQSLAAAYETVPEYFYVHSLHSYFVYAGDARFPIIYEVKRVRDGRSFATRTVHAKQQGTCILTTNFSFVRPNSGGKATIQHASSIPQPVILPTDDHPQDIISKLNTPMVAYHLKPIDPKNASLDQKKFRHWMKARGNISEAVGHRAHSIALAYISDSYFLNAVAVLHDLLPYDGISSSEEDAESYDEANDRQISSDTFSDKKAMSSQQSSKSEFELGMMVSLDHTIYFHNQNIFRADEWMLSEMKSPWSGDGRALAVQHIFTSNGTLLATCHQEGVLRVNVLQETITSKL